MQAISRTVPHSKNTSKTTLWLGRILSALPVLFLVFDGAIKLVNIQPVVDASVLLGVPVDLAPSIGLLLIACIAVYLIPQTAVLGAILLTGYLGGAVAIHARVGGELFSLALPVLIGALLWGGLYLRDGRLAALIPLRR